MPLVKRTTSLTQGDTVVVDALQTISVAVQTPLVASPVPLMFHCHILEHEDARMMGQFITT